MEIKKHGQKTLEEKITCGNLFKRVRHDGMKRVPYDKLVRRPNTKIGQ